MHTQGKPKQELLDEIEELRRRVQALQVQRAADAPPAHSPLIEHNSEAVITTDLEFNILGWNHAAEQLYAWRAEEVIGRPIGEIIPTRYEDESGTEVLSQFFKEGEWKGEVIQEHRDGSPINVLSSVSLLKNDEGDPIGAVAVNRDITARKQMEETLRRTTRAYRVLSECNQTLVREGDEAELLEQICHILVELGGYRLAWVGFANEDEEKSVRPVAQAGFESGYLEGLNITWEDSQRGRGPTGTAIRTGKPSVNRDVLTNPNFAPWREEAKKRGYASSISLPLRNDSRTLGALNIYAPEPDAFDDDEVKLLTELADDLAYGIVALRARAEQARVEKVLKESERKYRNLVENSIVGIYTTKIDGDILYVNDALAEIFEFESPEEMIAEGIFARYKDPTDRNDFIAALKRTREVANYELEVLTKTGKPKHVLISAALDGELLHGMIMDITERMETQKALQESEGHFRTVMESMTAAVVIVQDDEMHFVNPAVEDMTGYSREEIRRMDFWDIIHPQFRDMVKRRAMSRLRGEEVPSRYITLLQTKNREELWVDISAEAIDYRGHPAIMATAFDITERVRQDRELEAIAIVSRALRQAETRAEMLPIVLNQLMAILDAESAAIEIYDPASDHYVIELAAGAWEAATGDKVSMEVGVTPEVIKKKEPFVNNDVKAEPDPRFSHPDLMKRVKAVAATPLIAHGEAIGALWIGRQATIGRNEIRVLNAIGDIAANAIHRASLWEQAELYTAELAERVNELEDARQALKKRNVELSRLYRASESLITSPSPELETLAGNIVDSVIEEFGKSNCSLFLIKPDSERLNRLAIAGPFTREVGGIELYLDGPGLVPKASRRGEILNVGDVFAEDDYVRNWEGARSELVVPLKTGERIIGALDLQSSRPRAFTPEDERLMSIFAERAALALENARLFAAASRRLDYLQALHNMDIAITSSLDLQLTFNVLLSQVVSQLQVDAATLMLTTPFQTLEYAAGRGFSHREVEEAHLNFGDSFAGEVALERRPVHIPDLREAEMPPPFASVVAEENFKAYFAHPLIAKGEIKGVLEIFHRSRLQPDPEWIGFLEAISEQAAIAIHNAELYDNLQLAKTDLEIAYSATLEGWVRALDMRDQATEGHTQRVTEMTQRLAREIGIPKKDLVHITRGALLHDIGKLAIPDSILHKTGPLNDHEWEMMRMHPIYAYEMLSPIKYLLPAIDIPYCHHEKWDGSGYPRGLEGDQIPLAARIFAVVDVWDALRSHRPYREAWPEDKARQYLREEAGAHFDPSVVEVFFDKILNHR